jgi:hypothetical protein
MIDILVEAYGKRSYGDDPKPTTKFNPSTQTNRSQSTGDQWRMGQ